MHIRQVELESQKIKQEVYGKSGFLSHDDDDDDDKNASTGVEGVIFYKPGGVVYK